MPLCYACRMDADGHIAPSLAFLAGVAFIAQHNDAAVKRLMCPMHADVLVHAAKGSAAAVAPEDRRQPK